MKIKDIYQKYCVTPNLQEHMLRVATVARIIADNWRKTGVNKTVLTKLALLHDIGNIVKFNLDQYPEFLGKEITQLQFWKEKQAKMMAKFGRDDHEASRLILKEIGVDNKLVAIILRKSFGNCLEVRDSRSWYQKILLYADLRVLPDRIGTIEERFEDILTRMPKYANRPDINDLFSACREIEKQIESNLRVKIKELVFTRAEEVTRELLETEI